MVDLYVHNFYLYYNILRSKVLKKYTSLMCFFFEDAAMWMDLAGRNGAIPRGLEGPTTDDFLGDQPDFGGDSRINFRDDVMTFISNGEQIVTLGFSYSLKPGWGHQFRTRSPPNQLSILQAPKRGSN